MEFPEKYTTREELLQRLRKKREALRPKAGACATTSNLAAQIALYTNLPESEIKTLIAGTSEKKIAKNPLSFARKVASLLP
jgi:hypothetical protein